MKLLKKYFIFILLTFIPSRYLLTFINIAFISMVYRLYFNISDEEIIDNIKLRKILDLTNNDDVFIFPIKSSEIIINYDEVRKLNTNHPDTLVKYFINNLPIFLKFRLGLDSYLGYNLLYNKLVDVYHKL